MTSVNAIIIREAIFLCNFNDLTAVKERLSVKGKEEARGNLEITLQSGQEIAF